MSGLAIITNTLVIQAVVTTLRCSAWSEVTLLVSSSNWLLNVSWALVTFLPVPVHLFPRHWLSFLTGSHLFPIHQSPSSLDSWGQSFQKWLALPQHQHISLQSPLHSVGISQLLHTVLVLICWSLTNIPAAILMASSWKDSLRALLSVLSPPISSCCFMSWSLILWTNAWPASFWT